MNLKHSMKKVLLSTLITSGVFIAAISSGHSAGFLDDLEMANRKVEDADKAEREPSFAGSFLSALSAGANGDDPAAIDN
ncbi:MAG: hypothetical protein WBC71_03355, partial [Salaquimonas sp.]